jgi:hypothetical protein
MLGDSTEADRRAVRARNGAGRPAVLAPDPTELFDDEEVDHLDDLDEVPAGSDAPVSNGSWANGSGGNGSGGKGSDRAGARPAGGDRVRGGAVR